MRLKVDARTPPPATIARARRARQDFPGEAPVLRSTCVTSQGPKLLELGPGYRVQPEPDFFAEVKALLGEAAVL